MVTAYCVKCRAKREIKDPKEILLEKLIPKENDIVIIASSDDSFVAEISAINSVLCTLAIS